MTRALSSRTASARPSALLSRGTLLLSGLALTSLGLAAFASAEPPAATPGAATANVAASGDPTAPPGMVLIKGGKTEVGVDPDDIERMLRDNEALRNLAPAFWAMTPDHQVQVDDFFLMVTEVTNEQYAVFVRATGAKPPEAWGEKTINEASRVFLDEEQRKRDEAKEAGRPAPPRTKFDETEWWNKNWEGKPWEVPKGTERKPVSYVDYGGAVAYARWAGLRLPTEFEYVRAVRGDTDRDYPWGDDFDVKSVAISENPDVRGLFSVGSFPDGASPEGVQDLIGNVWEWTSSPFTAFPKFQSKTLVFGTGKNAKRIEPLPNWDANRRVIVGAGYHNSRLEARATTRGGQVRDQTSDALGFRCAASPAPGVDMANTVQDQDLPVSVRPLQKDGSVVRYDVTQTLAVDSWRTTPPAPVAVNAGASKVEGRELPVGYEVIGGYDYFMFVPSEKIDAAAMNDFTKEALESGPIHLGFFSSNQRIVQPDLPAGSYMVAIRPKGEATKSSRRESSKETPEGGEEAKPVVDVVAELGLDIEIDNLIFYDRDLKPVGSIPALGLDYAKLGEGHTVKFFDKDYTVKEKDAAGDEIEVPVHEEWLRFDAWVPSRIARKGFLVGIGLRIENDLETSGWRIAAH